MNTVMSIRGDRRAAKVYARFAATIRTLLFTAVLVTVAVPTAADNHAADIVVVDFDGDVTIEKPDAELAVAKNMVLVPPFAVHTGTDATITIAQGDTEITVKPNSELFVPAPKSAGSRMDTIRQERGNAMYDVETQPGSEVRIETPFLVSVIKGTQFNVFVDDAQASVSLFEGQLEIQRGSQVDDLLAGEIAIGRLGETGFNILKPDEALREQTDDLGASRPDDGFSPGDSPAGRDDSLAEGDAGYDELSDDDLSEDDVSEDDLSEDDASDDGDLGDEGLDDGVLDDDFGDDLDDDIEDLNDDNSDDDSDDDSADDDPGGKGRGKDNGGL